MKIVLKNSGAKYNFDTIEAAIRFARSQRQVQDILDQIRESLIPIKGSYMWKLKQINDGFRPTKYIILAQANGQEWVETPEMKTPQKALQHFMAFINI